MPLATVGQTERPLRVAELLASLSHALDLTEGQPPGHCVRACWIAMNVGRALGLSDQAMTDLHYAVILKDAGCSSNAARLCKLYLGDDLLLKRESKLVRHSLPQIAAFVLRHTAVGAPLGKRVRALLDVARENGALREVTETRCERGADIARQMRFSEDVAGAIRALDEHWDGRGHPLGLAGDAIPLFARIALLAQVVDVFHAVGGRDAAMREVRERSGTWFDPEVARALLGLRADGPFWTMLGSPDVEQAVLAMEPAQQMISAEDDFLDDVAAAFARVVDAKSPYTAGHSHRVAAFSEVLATELGLAPPARRRLRRAALLHDIGKLGVSNTILDKPGKLDDGEWNSMRGHASASERILSRVATFNDLAIIGGAHHERLDGRGYPRGLEAPALPLAVRIVSAADVCDALTATRPYRAAMPTDTALGIMRADSGTAFDPACIDALEAVGGRGEIARIAQLT